MNDLQPFLNLTPLGIAGLALGILFYYIKRNNKKVDDLGANHLHEIKESLQRMEGTLNRISDNTIFIKAKINGQK